MSDETTPPPPSPPPESSEVHVRALRVLAYSETVLSEFAPHQHVAWKGADEIERLLARIAELTGREDEARRYREGKNLAFAHLSDAEMANYVRMLMRDDLDHEAVLTGARDRIMHLSARIAELERERDEARAGAEFWRSGSASGAALATAEKARAAAAVERLQQIEQIADDAFERDENWTARPSDDWPAHARALYNIAEMAADAVAALTSPVQDNGEAVPILLTGDDSR